jgi:hypothetical protein
MQIEVTVAGCWIDAGTEALHAPSFGAGARFGAGWNLVRAAGGETTWKEFLTQHWELLVAADFFSVEVWTPQGLQRFLVL